MIDPQTTDPRLERPTIWRMPLLPRHRARPWATLDQESRHVIEPETIERTPETVFVSRVVNLCRRGFIDDALRTIFRWVNERCELGAFGSCAAMLKAFSETQLAPDILVGLLAATYPARVELGSSRTAFVNRVRGELARELGDERTASILSRLG